MVRKLDHRVVKGARHLARLALAREHSWVHFSKHNAVAQVEICLQNCTICRQCRKDCLFCGQDGVWQVVRPSGQLRVPEDIPEFFYTKNKFGQLINAKNFYRNMDKRVSTSHFSMILLFFPGAQSTAKPVALHCCSVMTHTCNQCNTALQTPMRRLIIGCKFQLSLCKTLTFSRF